MRAVIRNLFFLCPAFIGCTNKVELNENSVPTTLLIGVYAGEGPEASVEKMGPITTYLEATLGIPVELIKATDYTAVIEALRANKVHMAYLSPFSYVLASEKTALDVLVTFGINGKPYHYRSMIITGKNSGIRTMDDVRARAKELTLCFPDPASASGHLIPRAYLNTIGLNPKTSFKQTVFSSGHTEAVMSVVSGKVDIGCTSVLMKDLLIRKGFVKDGDIVVLWTSDPIVTNPIVIRRDINKQFAEKVKQAYLNLPSRAPDVWRNYLSTVYGESVNDSLTLIVAHDSLYNGLRKLAQGLTDLATIP